MSTLDRYIARSFLEPFAVALLFILGLYIVGDAFNYLEDYLDQAGSVGLALRRMARTYTLRIPTFVAPILPVAMLLGAAYGLSQLSGRNELTAMKACGISLWRILAPVYVAVVILALLGMANREFLVPKVEGMVASDLSEWTGQSKDYERITLYHEPDQTFFTLYYSVAKRRARNVSITNRATREYIRAGEARPEPGGWLLTDVEIGSKALRAYHLKTSLRPWDLRLALLDPSVCPLKMLVKLIRGNPDDPAYRVFYHSRLAYPFVSIVLVGLGLPFVIGNEKVHRSRMLGVGVCVLVCLVFYTVQFIAQDLGQTGALPAALAAWLPTVIFGALGLYLLETVHS